MGAWELGTLAYIAGMLVTGRALYVAFFQDLTKRPGGFWQEPESVVFVFGQLLWPLTWAFGVIAGLGWCFAKVTTYPTKRQRIERREDEERARQREIEQARARAEYEAHEAERQRERQSERAQRQGGLRRRETW